MSGVFANVLVMQKLSFMRELPCLMVQSSCLEKLFNLWNGGQVVNIYTVVSILSR